MNLSELATAFVAQAKTESNYKRLQRFFAEFERNYFSLAQRVVALMEIPQPWALSLDRTTWSLATAATTF